MILRTRSNEKMFTNKNLVAGTYRTFSEREGIEPKKKTPAVIFIDIEVKNSFRVCFEV